MAGFDRNRRTTSPEYTDMQLYWCSINRLGGSSWYDVGPVHQPTDNLLFTDRRMPRINVTGNAGVGKSTLAAHIALLVDAPLFGLDQIVWRPGWKQPERDKRTAMEQALCAQTSWVIDGVSRGVREAADMIVFLDYPRRISFWRCARRNWRYLFRSRPGLPPDCPEILIVPTLVKMIWRFPTKVRPALLAEFDEWKGEKTLVHIRSNRDLAEFMHWLECADTSLPG